MTHPSSSPRRPKQPIAELSIARVRALWIGAQRLDTPEPFGSGPEAVRRAVEHLGYVQIDTINVIERSHHHILFNRIPAYRRADLEFAQSEAKTVFEFWTHALSYVPVRDFRFFVGQMKGHRAEPMRWYADADVKEIRKVVRRVRKDGALTISDITDDTLIEKDHPWASRKPSKRALQAAFYCGDLVIARRSGMLKTYELTLRHFGWERLPKAANGREIIAYLLERALTSQGIVTAESAGYLHRGMRPLIAALIEKEARAGRLVPVAIAGTEAPPFWARPETLGLEPAEPQLTHILSPFDPIIRHRGRTALFFGYDHLFEAYLPKAKRKFGYFTLPVLVGDAIVAALDLKADRQSGKLLIQAWHWVGKGKARTHKAAIEAALERFARFQFGN